MRILCPTDFSTASLNGIEYAAKFAEQLNASLNLINIQSVTLNSGNDKGSIPDAESALKTLEDISVEIESTYKVKCDYSFLPVTENFEKIIIDKSVEYDLAIIGSNGANDLTQFYFGSHSFRMSKQFSIPVIIVPEGAEFQIFRNIVFASDYTEGDTFQINQLIKFAKPFDPDIHFLHISKIESELGLEVYRSFCRFVEENHNYSNKIHFKRIVDDAPVHAIEKHVSETKSEALALIYQEHSLLYRLFHEDLIKKITSYAEFPVIILHE